MSFIFYCSFLSPILFIAIIHVSKITSAPRERLRKEVASPLALQSAGIIRFELVGDYYLIARGD
jgi:hypothetical protein